MKCGIPGTSPLPTNASPKLSSFAAPWAQRPSAGSFRPTTIIFTAQTGGDEPAAVRIRFANGAVKHIADLENFRRVVDAVTGTQLGVTPDDSVLLTRDIGLQEIYALTVNWP